MSTRLSLSEKTVTEKKKHLLTFFPWPETASSDQLWEMEQNLETLLSIPDRIHRIWQEVTSKHHLDQTTSEMLFLEKYNPLERIEKESQR